MIMAAEKCQVPGSPRSWSFVLKGYTLEKEKPDSFHLSKFKYQKLRLILEKEEKEKKRYLANVP